MARLLYWLCADVPVNFEDGDDEKQVKTSFTLGATDQEAHLKNMQMLVQVLMNEEVLERLKNIQSPEELLEIDENISRVARFSRASFRRARASFALALVHARVTSALLRPCALLCP